MNYREPMDVFEAMGTAVSMRWLKPDPVPREMIDKLRAGEHLLVIRAYDTANNAGLAKVVVR